MGLQVFRADRVRETCANGARVWVTVWMGGNPVAKVENCPVDNRPGDLRRTVYATNHPDTFFSIPAACKIAGRTVRGFLTSDDNGMRFYAYTAS